MSEHDFWIAVRAALLLFIDAIERKEALGKYAKAAIAKKTPTDTLTLEQTG